MSGLDKAFMRCVLVLWQLYWMLLDSNCLFQLLVKFFQVHNQSNFWWILSKIAHKIDTHCPSLPQKLPGSFFLLVLAQAHNKYRYFQFLYIIYEYLDHLGLFVSIYNGSGLGLQACGNNMSDLVSFHSGQVEFLLTCPWTSTNVQLIQFCIAFSYYYKWVHMLNWKHFGSWLFQRPADLDLHSLQEIWYLIWYCFWKSKWLKYRRLSANK